jgi:CDP-glucose 4,6-dehydratase
MKLQADAVNCFGGVYRKKRVLVTGHTGFKGSWLCEWLLMLGADVTGFSLPPPTEPALFDQLGLASRIRHVAGDVRDLEAVRRTVDKTKPDFVFHLAAQPLVRLSYEKPVETYATNVMGTVNVLEALRLAAASQPKSDQPCVAVMVTTDKCYENKEWVHSYREEDPLGGYDPYSSSKGAAELVIAAYRRSYFSGADCHTRVASARAGNVIGGGDWAMDRIVPDCIRALQRDEVIPVRNKIATRPWQHVLEPLSGYLWLGAMLSSSQPSSCNFQPTSAFNFGPDLASNRTVAELVQEVLRHWPGRWEDKSDPADVHEARLLNLATDKAFHFLQWRPSWSFEETVAATVAWYYRHACSCDGAAEFTRMQIDSYLSAARTKGLAWSR